VAEGWHALMVQTKKLEIKLRAKDYKILTY
jgi:hypothetical protein